MNFLLLILILLIFPANSCNNITAIAQNTSESSQKNLADSAKNFNSSNSNENSEPNNEKIVNANTYKAITNDINNILSNKELLRAKYSLTIFSSKLNNWIYTKNQKTLLTPASNTKLFTTFTTYSLLGENYKLKTSIATDGKIDNEILNGNLYIIGGGDALLTISDIEIIADEIKKLGIKKINGNIYGDGSLFDKITNRFKYSGDKDEVQAVAPVTALSVERNIVTVIVTSGSIAGKPVNVQFKPASSAFAYSNSAVVSRAKTKRNVQISSKINAKGLQTFHIKGTLSPNRTYSYKYFIQNPVLTVAGILKDRLIAGGVTVSGEIAEKNLSNTQNLQLYSFTRDINEMINIANKNSDNYVAEMLFKLNGATAFKDSSIAKSASIAALQNLANNRINSSGYQLNDGSGLSRRNLVTTEGLVQLLLYSSQKSFANHFLSSLSIAGIDGTLAKRMLNSRAFNNLKAKTGTLANVSSLAGLVETNSGDTLYFAYIFNGGSVGFYKGIENQISMKIAEY